METAISSTELQTKPILAKPEVLEYRRAPIKAFCRQLSSLRRQVSVSLRARRLFWSCPAFAFPSPQHTSGWQDLDVWCFSSLCFCPDPQCRHKPLARMAGHGMGELFTKTQQNQSFPGHKGASEPFLLGWVGRISRGSSEEMVLSSQCCVRASPELQLPAPPCSPRG